MNLSAIGTSRRAVIAAALVAASAVPALAHHMEGGSLPDSFSAGLLSGIGHPIIGLDHFAFIAGVGIASAFLPRGIFAILAFILATLAGCAIHLTGATLPLPEIIIAASVLIVGGLIMTGRALPAIAAMAIFAIAGLFHGYAYGEAIFGAEQTPLIAYLLGFAVIQTAIAVIAMSVARAVAASAMASPARLAGAVIAGIGITFLIQNIESAVIPAPAATQAPAA
jgi:urease accessory protein